MTCFEELKARGLIAQVTDEKLISELIDSGKLGRIQYLRGTHFQDMEAWPDYWMGLPPFWYATHAVAPLLYLSNTYATRVQCFGSGVMPAEEDTIVRLTEGNSCLIPASVADLYVEPNNSAGTTKLLETYIDNKNY